MNLRNLRQCMRQRRHTLSRAEQQAAARSVADQLEEITRFVQNEHMAGYWPWDGELNPLPFLERVCAVGKSVYLPVVIDDGLRFAPWQPGQPLCCNRFGIPEPDVPPSGWRLPNTLDLVLVPLVAFDRKGARLGTGGGFYDRSFAFRHAPNWENPLPRLIGLAYAFQQVESLVRQPWDIPLDAVVTERAAYFFGEGLERHLVDTAANTTSKTEHSHERKRAGKPPLWNSNRA